MDLPIGTRLKDTCQKCKELTTGIVTKTRKASFTCTKCNTKFAGRAYSIESSMKFITDEEEK